MNLRILVTTALLMAAALPSFGHGGCYTDRDGSPHCPTVDTRCIADRAGDLWCSPAGGGIVLDRYGDPVCGAGACVGDIRGDLFCSSAPRGAAGRDRYGAAICTGACLPARAQLCVRPAARR